MQVWSPVGGEFSAGPAMHLIRIRIPPISAFAALGDPPIDTYNFLCFDLLVKRVAILGGKCTRRFRQGMEHAECQCLLYDTCLQPWHLTLESSAPLQMRAILIVVLCVHLGHFSIAR